MIAAVTATFLLPACPRLKPKVGVRHDDRPGRIDDYFLQELEPERDEWQLPDQVIDAIGVGNGDKVAVAWAGAGYFVIPLIQTVGPNGIVYASDPSDLLLARLKGVMGQEGITNVEFIQSLPDDPELPYATADVAMVVNAQAYIDLPYAFFDNLRRGMRTGGVVAVIDWRKNGPGWPDRKYRRSKKEIIEMMEGMEFELVADYKFLPFQYFLIFKVIERYG